MPHYGLPTSETTAHLPKVRTPWLRSIYTLAGGVFLLTFVAGIVAIIMAEANRATQIKPFIALLLIPGGISFAVVVSAMFLDWVLFGRAINQRVMPGNGETYERMTEAPESGYHSSPTPLTVGQVLYFRDMRLYPTITDRYGKLFVESLSDHPLAGVELIDPLR